MLNEHVKMIRMKNQLKTLMKSFKKKNRLLTSEAVAFIEKYEAMIDNKEKYKKRVAKLHQQIIDQNLIFQNQQKQI